MNYLKTVAKLTVLLAKLEELEAELAAVRAAMRLGKLWMMKAKGIEEKLSHMGGFSEGSVEVERTACSLG